MVRLSEAQAGRQAARLAGVRADLRAAYAAALLAWLGKPELTRLGRPIVTEGYRSPAAQDALYEQGRTKPGPVVTYKRGGESKHNLVPARALDVAFLLANGQVSWSAELLARFAALMKRAPGVRWGGDWPGFRDRPHFEV
ncbi:M15 family peptidase [Hymenobacter gummosus]|uniref:M15 family peptidase n=1 Tax=Hymenobacter gummosus TaxID=1776032 RepID=A0A431TWD0_9BACT|nr:M15 family metallopeptidase [Hymenobacter gummosus]RTQ45850.1 M15 family peptidase [Hymenobacter gummosus]